MLSYLFGSRASAANKTRRAVAKNLQTLRRRAMFLESLEDRQLLAGDLAIVADNATQAEGNSGATLFTFTVTRAGDTTAAASADYSVTGSGSSPATADDFAGGAFATGTVSFAAEETSKTITIEVAGDLALEGDEGFDVTLSNPTGDATIATATAQGLIQNDDATLAIAGVKPIGSEGSHGVGNTFQFTVTRSGAIADRVTTVNYTVAGVGTHAASAEDFSTPTTGTLTFAAGVATQTIVVTLAGDANAEADETFSVTLDSASNGEPLVTASANGVILNDDLRAFTPGNLVIYRVGDGHTSFTNTTVAVAVALDEYTPSGVLVQSAVLPTFNNGAQLTLAATETALGEGMLSLSDNGEYIVLGGYNAAIGSAAPNTATEAAVKRIVGRISGDGEIDTSTVLTGSGATNIRGIASSDGISIWQTAGTGGVRYTTFGSTAPTVQVAATPAAARGIAVINGQLYVSTDSGTAFRMATVGTGAPTGTGEVLTNLPGFPTATTSPFAFYFADLDAGVLGLDTLYIADPFSNSTSAASAGEIRKYSLVDGSWVFNNAVSVPSVRGLTGEVSGGTVSLYATSAVVGSTNESKLIKLEDASGYNGSVTATPTAIVTINSLAENKGFRGVAFVPFINHEPTSVTLTGNTLAENVAADSVVGTLSTADANASDSFTYSLVAGERSDDNTSFTIVGDKLHIVASPNYEAKSSYTVRVRSTDGGGLFTEQAFTIGITNLAEAPTGTDHGVTLPQDSSYVFTLADFAFTDADVPSDVLLNVQITTLPIKGQLTYQGNPVTPLQSIPADRIALGELVYAPLAAEFGAAYASFTFQVQDDGGTAGGGIDLDPLAKTLTLNVSQVFEALSFNAPSYSFTVPENSAAGTVVGSALAVDPSGVPVTISLEGAEAASFVIDSVTGEIRLAAGVSLDFEGVNSFTFTAKAVSSTGEVTVPVTVSVSNVNEAPTLQNPPYNFTIAENSAPGTTVGSISASDVDAGTNLVYSLTGADAANFTIDPSTGAITVAADVVLNYEVKSSFQFDVIVSDGLLQDTATVAVSLIDVNEAPIFGLSSYLFIIPENPPANTPVGVAAASDLDLGATLTYSLTGEGADSFVIDPATGEISVATGAVLDFEVTPVYNLSVVASDGVLTSTVPVIIEIAGANEAPIFDTAEYSFTLAENSVASSFVGNVSATDEDVGTVLSYSLTGADAAYFSVDWATGAITVAADAILDFEVKRSFQFSVIVSDGALQDTSTVTVELIDVNETPAFTLTSYLFTIPENAPAGTAVGAVTASDQDAGNTITYSLSGTGASSFVINPETGAITVATGAVLNFEGMQTYNLTVVASDGTLSATASLTIRLTNVNEFPRFTSNGYHFYVMENAVIYTFVGQVAATDEDAGSTLTYSLSGDAASYFTINPATGVIQVAAGAWLDFETDNLFDLTVAVSDGSLQTTLPLTIELLNVNEPPLYLFNPINLQVQENSASGTIVGFANALDFDAGAIVTYTLSGTGVSNFVINPATGQITVSNSAQLDFENIKQYNLTVTASDGTLSAAAAVIIAVTNANEPPTFFTTGYTFTIPENSPVLTTVGFLVAQDIDLGTILRFSLSGTGAHNFSVNEFTGEITVAPGAIINFEGIRTFALTATVSDGGLSASIPVTINLTNVSEPPKFSAVNYAFSISENIPVGATVGTITAIAEEGGSTFTYSLTGTGVQNFAISPTTGVITVAAGAQISLSGTNPFNLTVTANDSTYSVSALVQITISQPNQAPVFAAPSYSFTLAENSAAGTNVGTVAATDADSPGALAYSLSGTGSEKFVIGATSGIITVAAGAVLDFEGVNNFQFTAIASDGVLTKSVPVTVQLTDVVEPITPKRWQNPVLRADVNNDGFISPSDALTIINYLNTNGPSRVPSLAEGAIPPAFYDANGDDFISPIDVLIVIDLLNLMAASGEGELGSAAAGIDAAIVSESDSQSIGTDIAIPYNADLESQIDWLAETEVTRKKRLLASTV